MTIIVTPDGYTAFVIRLRDEFKHVDETHDSRLEMKTTVASPRRLKWYTVFCYSFEFVFTLCSCKETSLVSIGRVVRTVPIEYVFVFYIF